MKTHVITEQELVEACKRSDRGEPEPPISPPHCSVPCDLLDAMIALVHVIQNSRKGHFGMWTGYEPQIACSTVDSLADRLREVNAKNTQADR